MHQDDEKMTPATCAESDEADIKLPEIPEDEPAPCDDDLPESAPEIFCEPVFGNPPPEEVELQQKYDAILKRYVSDHKDELWTPKSIALQLMCSAAVYLGGGATIPVNSQTVVFFAKCSTYKARKALKELEAAGLCQKCWSTPCEDNDWMPPRCGWEILHTAKETPEYFLKLYQEAQSRQQVFGIPFSSTMDDYLPNWKESPYGKTTEPD